MLLHWNSTGPESKFTDRFIVTPESCVGSGAGFGGFATAFLTAGRKIGCLAFSGGDCKFSAFAGGGGVVVLSAAAGG